MQGKSSLPPKPVTDVWRPELVRLPKMTAARCAFRAFGQGLAKLITKVCLNVTVEGRENFPKAGPLLVVINHIGDLDLPVLISMLPSLPMRLARSNCMNSLFLEMIDWYGVIWLHRGRSDIRALRAALDGFAEGRIIVIAPEGRYSVTGALEEGNGGAAFLAYKSGAPILPIAITGTENENVYGHLRRFRRARVHVKVGKMFRLTGQALGRQEAVDQGTHQIMASCGTSSGKISRGVFLRYS